MKINAKNGMFQVQSVSVYLSEEIMKDKMSVGI